MPEFDPIKYAIPLFVVLILAELVYATLTKKARYEPWDSFGSLMMGLGNMVAGALFGGLIVAIFVEVAKFAPIKLGYVWWAWIACFVLDDFFYYIFHRSAHRVRWFWASHVNHHSSQHYNLSTALRQTWTGFFALSFIFDIPLILMGFPVPMIIFCGGLNLIYQFWVHTEVVQKCPRWFEAIMNTPSHHRVHHATNPQYLDSNYAGVFIIWDRMLGTFVPEKSEDPAHYGLVYNLSTFNPLRIAFHEWAALGQDLLKSRAIGHVFGYIFGPPGWSPDGSRETSRSLKAKWLARRAQSPEQSRLEAAE
jgi:sterol desaturase/sphingolipid hydroxylase (fatty acid hydroxylase superfamily)